MTKTFIEFHDWINVNEDFTNLPAEVYAVWFKIYTSSKEEDLHTEFAKVLSCSFLDIKSEFTRQSCKLLSVQLVAKVQNDYAKLGLVEIFSEEG